MATNYYAEIEKLYVAYFNRPADTAGLEFWRDVVAASNGDTRAVSIEFANSTEYKSHYAGMDDYQIVTEVYHNLFSRAPEAAGLDYWVKGMAAGLFTIDDAVTAIATGAQGSDQTAYNNKVIAATSFTASLDTAEEISTYAAADTAMNNRAKDFLAAITDDASLRKVITQIDMDHSVLTVLGLATPAIPVDTAPATPITTAPVETTPVGTTPAHHLILTASRNDMVVGTSGNDTINADYDVAKAVLTLNGVDSINGADGNDTVAVASTAGVSLDSSITVTNIENLQINNTAGTINADVSGWTGLQHVAIQQAGGDPVIVTTGGNVVQVAVTGGQVTIDDNGTTAKLTDVSLAGFTGEATIQSDALTSLELVNASGNVIINAVDGVRELHLTISAMNGAFISDATATTLDVNAIGASSSVTLGTGAATVLNLGGDQNLVIGLTEGAGAINTISSTNTAGVTLLGGMSRATAFIGGDGADQITVSRTTRTNDMGAGDDTVKLSSTLGSGSVAGGAGTDTLLATASVAADVSVTEGSVTGFEKLGLGASTGSNNLTIDLANLGGINTIMSAGNSIIGTQESETATFTALQGGAGITVAGLTVTALGASNTTVSAVDVAAAFIGSYTGTALSITGALSGWSTTPGPSSQVNFISLTGGDVADLTPTVNNVAAPAIPVVDIANGTSSAAEIANVTFGALQTGQSVTVGNSTYYAAIATSAADLATWFKAQGQPGYAAAINSGTPTTVTFTSQSNGNLADLAVSVAGTAQAALAPLDVYDGLAGLAFKNLDNNGTFELTGANVSTISVDVTGAAVGTEDILNIKLNGAENIVNSGSLSVYNVETVNIVATDSSVGNDPMAASKINLLDAAAKTITVSGNHGVNFTDSTLSALTTLNASGVTAAGAAGAVTFAAQTADNAVSVITASGNDMIDLRAITSSSVVNNIDTGAGDDIVWGSAGHDNIKLGSGNDIVYSSGGMDTISMGTGNDVYMLQSAAHSTLTVFDTITDFTANTVASGAAAASLNGDLISLKVGSTATAGISVQVVTSTEDAQTFLNQVASTNSTTHLTGIALDSTTGRLYIDLDGNGTIDSSITLIGVNTITETAFVVTH